MTAEELAAAALAAKGAPPADTPKTFTQDEVNALVGRVRGEVKAQFQDYDDLKAKAGKFDGLQRDQLTEQEKMRQDLAKEQRLRADAEGRIAVVAIDSAIRVRAAESGFINPSAALRMVNRDGIKYNEDGGVTGVDEALAALKGTDPYLLAPAGRQTAPNVNPARGAPGQGRALTEDQRDAARRMHLSEEEYAKGLPVVRT
ncbi:MAG: phage scaffolding protein [Dehalococcoidia bacterium]|nr:phage scaffolding protein [Dehalococcoidia bacterium]